MVPSMFNSKKSPLILLGGRQTWDFIVDTCDALGIEVLGFVDRFYAGRIDEIDGLPCLGSDMDLYDNPKMYKDAQFFIGSFWDGDSNLNTENLSGYQLRLDRMQLIKDLDLPTHTLIDPRAMLSKKVEVGEGTYIGRGVNIRAGAKIGKHCILTDESGFANDVEIGDNCVLSGGAYLMSNVKLGNNVYVGTRATVLNGHSSKQNSITIGDDCKIYAHALVTDSMPPGTTMVYSGRQKLLSRQDIGD